MTAYSFRLRVKGDAYTLEALQGVPDGTYVITGNHAGDGTDHIFRVEHRTPEDVLTNSADTIHTPVPVITDPSPVPAKLSDWAPPPEALRPSDFGEGFLPAPEPLRSPAPVPSEGGPPEGKREGDSPADRRLGPSDPRD